MTKPQLTWSGCEDIEIEAVFRLILKWWEESREHWYSARSHELKCMGLIRDFRQFLWANGSWRMSWPNSWPMSWCNGWHESQLSNRRRCIWDSCVKRIEEYGWWLRLKKRRKKVWKLETFLRELVTRKEGKRKWGCDRHVNIRIQKWRLGKGSSLEEKRNEQNGRRKGREDREKYNCWVRKGNENKCL